MPVALAKREYFLFDAQDTSGQDLVGGTNYSTASQSVSVLNAGTYTVGAWTENIPVTGKIRVRVHFTGGSTTDRTVRLLIDGVEVASVTLSPSPTTDTVVIDYVGDITAGSHTLEVQEDLLASLGSSVTDSAYLDIVNGLGTTSTTEETIISTALPSYRLELRGEWKFEVGVRVKVEYNRKATQPITLKINGQELQNYDNTAVDDGVGTVTGYGTGPLADPVVISGLVGAGGDAVIIVHAYIQITLRGNQDSVLVGNINQNLIKEDKYSVFLITMVGRSLDGASRIQVVRSYTLQGYVTQYSSTSGIDVTTSQVLANAPFGIVRDRAQDGTSTSYFVYVHIVEVG